MPQILELAQCLSELEGRGALPRYKAILAANDCQDLLKILSLAAEVDEYFFEPQVSSPEDVAKSELNVILCERDTEALLPHIDLLSYGRALLERDQAMVTSYGLVERDTTRQVLEEDQTPNQGGMEMM